MQNLAQELSGILMGGRLQHRLLQEIYLSFPEAMERDKEGSLEDIWETSLHLPGRLMVLYWSVLDPTARLYFGRPNHRKLLQGKD